MVTPDGLLQLLRDVKIAGDNVVVRNHHTVGDAQIQWGWSKLRKLGRLIAEKLNVDYIEIMERVGQQVRTRDVVQVSSGSPVRMSLTIRHGASTPEAPGYSSRDNCR